MPIYKGNDEEPRINQKVSCCSENHETSTEIINLGCRLNTYEGEVIRKLNEPYKGKRVIINTCAVTKSAAAQSLRTVRRMRKLHPEAFICATGCASQLKPNLYKEIADRVVGNAAKLLPESYAENAASVIMNDFNGTTADNPIMIDRFKNRARAFIEVQNGCNHSCTFCNIPFSRGKNRSIPPDKIINQAMMLSAASYNEITLTGVDITDYGTDIGMSLAMLIEMILHKLPNLARLRLSSIDVAEADNHLIRLLATEQRLMPHLHLSLQSGDDLILKRMRRRHSRDQVYAFCDTVRAVRKDVVFGADIIAGFPTETEAMFANTYNMLHELNFALVHVFPFSANDDTPAARMPQVDSKTIKERAKLLRNLARMQAESSLLRLVGSKQKILLETPSSGKTEHYLNLELDTPAHQVRIGDIIEVTVKNTGKKVIAMQADIDPTSENNIQK